jgi:hypothetical protein
LVINCGPSWARTSDPLIMSEIQGGFWDCTDLYWSSLSFTYNFGTVLVVIGFHMNLAENLADSGYFKSHNFVFVNKVN